MEVEFVEVFKFEHHNSTDNLKVKIDKLLNTHPERLQDFYKIAKALVN